MPALERPSFLGYLALRVLISGWSGKSWVKATRLASVSAPRWRGSRGAVCTLYLLPAILLQEQTVLGKEATGRSPVDPRWRILGLHQVPLLHQVHTIHSEFLEREITCCCLTQSIGIWIFCHLLLTCANYVISREEEIKDAMNLYGSVP